VNRRESAGSGRQPFAGGLRTGSERHLALESAS
jgi:hypothetical protein